MMSRSEICEQFKIDSFDGAVVYANYEEGSYEGSASIIYAADDKLFMVSASHCSCNGLEGSWDPDEVTVDMLRKMAESGYGEDKKAAQHVVDMLDKFHAPDVRALVAHIALTGAA